MCILRMFLRYTLILSVWSIILCILAPYFQSCIMKRLSLSLFWRIIRQMLYGQ